METARSSRAYAVAFEWRHGVWVARALGVRGCTTWGKSLAEAERRIRDGLRFFVDEAATAEIRPVIKAPPEVSENIRAAANARERAQAAAKAAQAATQKAARSMVGAGMSRRDAARLLGISHQRVQQLLTDTGR